MVSHIMFMEVEAALVPRPALVEVAVVAASGGREPSGLPLRPGAQAALGVVPVASVWRRHCLATCAVGEEASVSPPEGLRHWVVVEAASGQPAEMAHRVAMRHGAVVEGEVEVVPLPEGLVGPHNLEGQVAQGVSTMSPERPVPNLAAVGAVPKTHSAARGATASASSPFTD